MGDTDIEEMSYHFALRIVKLNEYLHTKRHFVLAKQILRSRTAIGALVCEAQYAQSRADFVHKPRIGLKEANETRYWLRSLRDSDYLDLKSFESLKRNLERIIRVLSKIINTSKKSSL